MSRSLEKLLRCASKWWTRICNGALQQSAIALNVPQVLSQVLSHAAAAAAAFGVCLIQTGQPKICNLRDCCKFSAGHWSM